MSRKRMEGELIRKRYRVVYQVTVERTVELNASSEHKALEGAIRESRYTERHVETKRISSDRIN